MIAPIHHQKNRVLLVLFFVLNFSACSIKHYVAEDYGHYLANNTGTSNLPQTNKSAKYFISEKTKGYKVEFRSVTSGYGNLWIVDFGKILERTFESKDVQNAFAHFSAATKESTQGMLIIFDVQKYEYVEHGAHIFLKATIMQDNKLVLEKSYEAHGKTQAGKTIMTGVFGMKNAIQQSTKLAMDDILRSLLSDLREKSPNT